MSLLASRTLGFHYGVMSLGIMLVVTGSWQQARAQQAPNDFSYQIRLSSRDRMDVQWRPPASQGLASLSSMPQATQDADTRFKNSLLEVLQNALITKLQARVTLESVTVEKGRVRLSGVLLRDAKIGLRIQNENAQRLVDTLLQRYDQKEDTPPWLRVLQLAKFGIYNDLEIGLSLEELSLRHLAVDADALKVVGLAVRADGGSNQNPVEATEETDQFRAILRVLQQAAISRAEAHLNLDHLEAKRLKLALEGGALKNLHILVALRRADSAAATLAAKP